MKFITAAAFNPASIRRLVAGSLFIALFLVPGCSYLVQFVVVNKTDHRVEVTCSFRKAEYGQLKNKQLRLAVSGEKSFFGNYQFKTINHSVMLFNENNRSVKVSLPAGSALNVFEILNYPGHDSYRAKQFAVETIEWASPSHRGKIQGRSSVLHKFSRKSNALYEFNLPPGES